MTRRKDYFPEDLIIEILSRLPVKSLMRFKCVGKSWYALVKNRSFIYTHLKNYNENDNNSRLLISFFDMNVNSAGRRYHLFLDEKLMSYQDFTPSVAGVSVLDEIWGPYDGLFFLYDRYHGMFMFNPATKESKQLPKYVTTNDIPSHTVVRLVDLGFGLDSMSDDYKVLFISSLNEPTGMGQYTHIEYLWENVGIYSLRSNCWREVKFVQLNRYRFLAKPFTNWDGVCYWWAFLNDWSSVIVTFHWNEEVFGEIQLPEIPKRGHQYVTVGVHNNSLNVLCFDQRVSSYAIWVMKDDYSWTKQSTFGPFPQVRRLNGGLWKNGRFFGLSEKGNQILHYDSCTKELRNVGIKSCSRIYLYEESLITFNC